MKRIYDHEEVNVEAFIQKGANTLEIPVRIIHCESGKVTIFVAGETAILEDGDVLWLKHRLP